MHKLIYLPLAQKDLRDITSYISDVLKVPKAAMDFIDIMESSISRLALFPYSCKVYQPLKQLCYEYRVLVVKNYLVFYIVTEHEVEIHRIVYSKMDIQKLFNKDNIT